MIALGRVVVDDVKNHLDAFSMKALDHVLELDDLIARPLAAGVPNIGGEESDRVVSPKIAPSLLDQVAGDVAKIRARGGEVVFIRPPSSDFFRAFERNAVPRERVWEPVVGAAAAVGVHFEDYPALSDVRTPEWSHISAKDKARWTRALIGIVQTIMAERGIQRPELRT